MAEVYKPRFKCDNPERTREYECDEYTCNAHPRSCLFCKNCSDVWFDYTHGPYMIFCDEHPEDDPEFTSKGMKGKCKKFEEG